jgi:hypothetical protein
MKGFEFYPGEYRGVFGWMTNDGLALIGAGFAAKNHPAIRADIEGNYLRAIAECAPGLAERMQNGHREERFVGGVVPNYFRKPFGPGKWERCGLPFREGLDAQLAKFGQVMIRLEHKWKTKFEIAAREWKLANPSAPAETERKGLSNTAGRSTKHDANRRSRLRYTSGVKRAVLIQLTRNPSATDLEICRALDGDGAVELPDNWSVLTIPKKDLPTIDVDADFRGGLSHTPGVRGGSGDMAAHSRRNRPPAISLLLTSNSGKHAEQPAYRRIWCFTRLAMTSEPEFCRKPGIWQRS